MLRRMELKQIVLPCLRCGLPHVAFFAPKYPTEWNSGEVPCERCCALHYLVVKRDVSECLVVYDRFTMRYPMEQYDDKTFPRVELRAINSSESSEEPEDSLVGPIVIYKRKKHFSPAEEKTIWLNSHRKCHLCGKRWKLNERSRYGWHVDHLIPNVGGGKNTENMANFRVACARCNLRKGRGYTQRIIRDALKQLLA